MLRVKWSRIAHSSKRWLVPVPAAAIERLLDALELEPGAVCLDLGCGKGELLIRLAERFGASGRGVDRDAAWVADGLEEAARRGVSITLESGEAAEWARDRGGARLAACVGVRPFGESLVDTLGGLRALVEPGGWILVGEGHERDEASLTSHHSTRAVGEALGLVAAIATTAADRERYERDLLEAAQRWAREHPANPDRAAILDIADDWWRAWQKTPAERTGFGLYLYRH